ncbi:MAG TPA: hypothetical protein VMD09_10425 [Solirubrobacteraceae bacterium]|nr:hypothetical protein [Solirubrobacteraceae bacterium]
MTQFVRGATCTLLTALAVAGCGGSASSGNGLAAKPPNAIVQEANNAIIHASSVHVAGSISSGSVPLTLDLDLVAGRGGRGELSEGGLTFRVITVGPSVYIQGTPAFWTHFAGASVARTLDDKWLKAPASGQFAPIAALTNMQLLFGKVLLSHGSLQKVGTSTVNGQKVVGVRDSKAGGILYVAATGRPYPVEVVKRGTGAGRIVFDRINQPVALAPPANSRSLAQLH